MAESNPRPETPSTDAGDDKTHLLRTVSVGGSRVSLLGTAHVSSESVNDVAREIASGRYDAVAIELCDSRYRALTEPQSLERMNLFQVIRDGKAGMVAASLALGAYQQRLADQFDVKPGAEMAAALEGARSAGLEVFCIDREIGVTLKRVYRRTPWWRRMTLISGLFASTLSRESIKAEDIEQLKQGDLLEATFSEFAERSATLYECLISERDRYMAAKLTALVDSQRPAHVLAVVGAGHLAGLEEALREPVEEPFNECAWLDYLPPRGWLARGLPWLVVALLFVGFAIGFSQGLDQGTDLVIAWVAINGGLSALGALLAAGHPLTVITAFVAAPLTSLNPTIGAGFVTAAAELALRKPTVKDFRAIREDVARPIGWWRNRVSRTLLVFLFSTIGSAIGTYVGGFHIFEQVMR